jgi:succinylarginine dihydrolase
MTAHEINFDGLVGPTHNYAGLAFGNVASMANRALASHPKQAALQGLAKMKFLADLGIKQAVLPPHERPHLPTLRRLGFSGSDGEILEQVQRTDPALLAAVSSSSSMWAANAATVSPSADCADGRVHFTPANLVSHFHRSIEPATTTRILRAIFADESRFAVHGPLPATPYLGDEGAANHSRLGRAFAEPGVEVFAFGRVASDASYVQPKRFPARQTLEAAQAIARLHQLEPGRVVYIQQNPDAIDAGAFHNDVVSVANLNVMLYHERAYAAPAAWEQVVAACPHDQGWYVPAKFPLADAIASYVFNSQLVTLPDGSSMALIAPEECRGFPLVMEYLQSIVEQQGPVKAIHFVDVRQSMQNGGGPACLRLRVVLTDQEMRSMSANVMLTNELYERLRVWIEKHYRDTLKPEDLRDPKLLAEGRGALDELSQILKLGSIYDFQRG